MKESFYFPHDNNANQDPKIMILLSECGLSGVGMYWILIEILHQQESGMIKEEAYQQYIKFYCKLENKGEALIKKIEQVLNTSGLLLNKEGFVYSERVLKNKKYRNDISKKRSLAGKKSAAVRANPTSVEQKRTSVEQGKERKGKERKRKEIEVTPSAAATMEIRKSLGLPESFPEDHIVAVLEKFPKIDVAAVAMKVGGKNTGRSYSQLWPVFLNWCASEKTKEQEKKDPYANFPTI